MAGRCDVCAFTKISVLYLLGIGNVLGIKVVALGTLLDPLGAATEDDELQVADKGQGATDVDDDVVAHEERDDLPSYVIAKAGGFDFQLTGFVSACVREDLPSVMGDTHERASVRAFAQEGTALQLHIQAAAPPSFSWYKGETQCCSSWKATSSSSACA